VPAATPTHRRGTSKAATLSWSCVQPYNSLPGGGGGGSSPPPARYTEAAWRWLRVSEAATAALLHRDHHRVGDHRGPPPSPADGRPTGRL